MTEMKVTEQLKEEHEAIKLMLRILERVCQKLEAGEAVNSEHLEHILEFIQIFADRCHHGKEEGVLFPALEKEGLPREGGPIGVMLAEHDEGRGYVKGMSEAVVAYKSGDQSSSQFIENARNYVALLSQHIEKENNILYPMAEIHLSDGRQAEMLEEFEKIEEEKIGPGKHEEFHKLLSYLKEFYLNESGQ